MGAYLKMYTDVLNDHAPIKSRKIRSAPGQSKFITPEIRKAMWKRNALKRKYYKTRSSVDWEAFRTQRNRVVSMRRKSVVNYFDRLCVSRAGNPREFWRAVRPFMHVKKSVPEQCITLKDQETVIRDQNQVAETMNMYFNI